jgi:hypothetical protein
MNDSLLKIKVWTKLILLGLVILFVLVFMWQNHGNTANVWFFVNHQPSVLELLTFTFLAGVVATLLARPVYRTLEQISELRKKPAQIVPPPAPQPIPQPVAAKAPAPAPKP